MSLGWQDIPPISGYFSSNSTLTKTYGWLVSENRYSPASLKEQIEYVHTHYVGWVPLGATASARLCMKLCYSAYSALLLVLVPSSESFSVCRHPLLVPAFLAAFGIFSLSLPFVPIQSPCALSTGYHWLACAGIKSTRKYFPHVRLNPGLLSSTRSSVFLSIRPSIHSSMACSPFIRWASLCNMDHVRTL